MSKLKVGSVILFWMDPEENRPVAYTEEGKRVLCNYIIPAGFAKITEIAKEDYSTIWVDAKPVLCDLFLGMSYKHFLKVISKFNYRLGLDRRVRSSFRAAAPQHEFLAYHPEYKSAIVATTEGAQADPIKCLINSCTIYIPTFVPSGRADGSGGKTVIGRTILMNDPEMAQQSYEMRPLRYVAKTQTKFAKGDLGKDMRDNTNSWKGEHPPKMAIAYGDTPAPHARRTLEDVTTDIIATAHPDCIKIFEGCIGYDRIENLANKYKEKGLELWHWVE